MHEHLNSIFWCVLGIIFLILLSKPLEKVANKCDESPSGGNGTDIYVLFIWSAALFLSVQFIVHFVLLIVSIV